ncbi:hypothetical protein Q8A67_010639 [Cirrhinus molitorella]|uniref:Uncharacterized protein n=1 Tax=Cirrhinus molitorella TaxID=172907 RepID=A0AA88TQM9_9TELE|nr:hypothetical protein Q8A67_010639 [Cirrhinus molitorella]
MQKQGKSNNQHDLFRNIAATYVEKLDQPRTQVGDEMAANRFHARYDSTDAAVTTKRDHESQSEWRHRVMALLFNVCLCYRH